MQEECGPGSPKNQRSSSVRPMTFRSLAEADRQQLPPRDQWGEGEKITLMPDRDAAGRFLAALDPAASQFTFQTFDDDADRRSRDLARILHGSLNQHWGELCRLSASGAGVFVTINETNGRGRTAADVTRVRALFVDLDEVAALPEKFHAEPHIISESSRGKWHAYWLVRDCSPGEFGPLQQRLIRAYGSDPKVKDLSRVLRVPGFVHQKVKDGAWSMPFRSRLVEAHDHPAYSVEAAVAGLPEEREREKAQGNGQDHAEAPGATPWTAAEENRLRSALATIPTDPKALDEKLGDSHLAWVNVGRAIHRLDWGERGFAIWQDWCRQSSEYNLDGLRTNWRSFGSSRRDEKPVTIATVYHYAQQFIAAPAFSEEAIALELASRHRDGLRYVARWTQWFIWGGSCWREDEKREVFSIARGLCRETAVPVNKSSERRRIASAKTRAAVVSLASEDPRLAATVDQWDTDPWLLNTPAGVVDLRTGGLREHRVGDYVTKQAAASPGGACPKWKAFMAEVTAGDAELQAYLQRVGGYCLTGATHEHQLFFLYGTGNNGKSVFVKTLAGILGDYHRATSIETFTVSQAERHPTELAGLRGARLVTSTETEEGRRWAEARIKELTGGDKITARFMRQDFLDFYPQFKLLFSGNHMPRLRAVNKAITRRFNRIPFAVTVAAERVNVHLAEELREEWPGILAWLVEGCLAWQRGGLNPPEAVTAATESYLESQDVLGDWLDDCCDAGGSYWANARDLFDSWKRWAEERNEFVGSVKAFAQRLEDRGFKRSRSNRHRGFIGLQLKTEPAQQELPLRG
jgi:putative DNA primase/helicase